MAQDVQKSGPQPINIWLESLHSSVTSARGEDDTTRQARETKDEAILVLLGKLALHYWRPDFAPAQARELYRDYLDDLRGFPMADIAAAIQKYRMDGANRFYPTSGQIIDVILGKAELERENPGAPDRARRINRIGGQARNAAQAEVEAMAAKLTQLRIAKA